MTRPLWKARLSSAAAATGARSIAPLAARRLHARHLVALHRPRPKAEAYLRLSTLPGEQAQVDWGHFGHLEIGRARRALMAFVIVLAWSRMICLRFFLDEVESVCSRVADRSDPHSASN
jgi:hypothetical protein